MKIFAKIRFYWGAFIIACVVALLMIPATYIAPHRKGEILHYFNRLIIFLLGGKLEQVGAVDPDANLFVMNHQGIIDIVGLEALQRAHVSWVAKKELFELPLFGKIMHRTDQISIDRENKAGLIKLIKDVKESIEHKGRPVAIFPEGTRTKGQELLHFRAGAKFIASKLAMRIQPIVITGSKELLDEHDHTGHSAIVRYIYLEPFDVKEAGENWYEEMRENMQKVIDAELADHSRSR